MRKISLYEIALSDRCNFNCSYCYIKKKNTVEMNNRTLEKLIEWIKKTHGKRFMLKFSYGEPLLSFEQIKKIVSLLEIDDDYRKTIITTNGSLISNKKISWMKDHNIHLQVSIDGDKFSNRLRINPNKWKRIVKKAKAAAKELNLAIFYSIHPDNVCKMNIGFKTLVNNGFDKIILGLVDFGIPLLENGRIHEYISGFYENFFWACKNYFLGKKIVMNLPRFFNFFIEDNLIGFNSKKEIKQRCGAMVWSCFVSPTGYIYPCPYFFSKYENIFSMGNVFTGINNQQRIHWLNKTKTTNLKFLTKNSPEKLRKLSDTENDALFHEFCPFLSFEQTKTLTSVSDKHVELILALLRSVKELKQNLSISRLERDRLKKYAKFCLYSLAK